MSTAALKDPRQLSLRAAWSHGVGKELVADPGQPRADGLPDASGPQVHDLWPEATAEHVLRAVRAAVLPTRWDDWSGYNAHRPFPSARAKQAHSVHFRAGAIQARVDEVRGVLVDHRPVGEPGYGVLVRAEPDALPAGYGPIRYAIASLEAGHVVGALLERFDEQGLTVRRRLDLSDVQRPGMWLSPSASLSAVVAMVAPPVDSVRWARRCSGLDPRGLAPDPRPIPPSTWAQFVSSAPVSQPALRHRLAIHRVDGVESGVWESAPDGLTLIRRGEVQHVVARAFRAPPDAVRVSAMNVVWGISAPLATARGERDYPATLFAAGIAAQQVCRSAASVGMFARPVRGVDEPDVEAALQVPPDEDLIYTVLLGRPRVHGFTYDLSPVSAPPSPPGVGIPPASLEHTAYHQEVQP